MQYMLMTPLEEATIEELFDEIAQRCNAAVLLLDDDPGSQTGREGSESNFWYAARFAGDTRKKRERHHVRKMCRNAALYIARELMEEDMEE